MIYHSIPSGLQNIAKNDVYHVIRQMISNLCVLAPLAHIQKNTGELGSEISMPMN